MKRLLLLFPTLLVCAGSELAAQSVSSREYVVLAASTEMALARSAVPSNVSADATVWVVRDGQYEVAIDGTNENHCFVARTWPESLEPVCYDGESARTILPIEIRRFELRLRGLSREAIDQAVEAAVGAGELQVPRRPAMSYMMSSAQVLFGDDGRAAGAIG